MRDLILNLMLGFAAGGFMGWQLRGLLAERELYRAEELRDAEWDAAHGIGCGLEVD